MTTSARPLHPYWRLLVAGSSVRMTGYKGIDGHYFWMVTGTNGEKRLTSTGETIVEAWAGTETLAMAVGMLSGIRPTGRGCAN